MLGKWRKCESCDPYKRTIWSPHSCVLLYIVSASTFASLFDSHETRSLYETGSVCTKQLKNVLTAIIRIIILVLLLFAIHSLRHFFCTFVNWLRLINVNSRWWYVLMFWLQQRTNTEIATVQMADKIMTIWRHMNDAFSLCSKRRLFNMRQNASITRSSQQLRSR